MALVKRNGTEEEGAILRPWGFEKGIRQLFDDWMDFPKDWGFTAKEGEIFPKVDITETPQEYAIRAEIPGMRKEDVRLSVANNVLTLSGEKKTETKTEDKKFHRVESYYGSFRRSFVLPDPVNAEKITAGFKDGVLTVAIPKSEEAKEKTVDIKIG